MFFLKLLSLRSRFLVAPLIGIVLTIVLYVANNTITRSHADLIQQLYESNLPQVSEISRVAVLLTDSHSSLSLLLNTAVDEQDEERIYLQGREILNNLHKLEAQLNRSIGSTRNVIIKHVNIFEQIQLAFSHYREQVIHTIELSTVNPQLAHQEINSANHVLKRLNVLFLTLSEHYEKNLSEQSKQLESSLDDHVTETIFSILMLLAMILSALYFSKQMSSDMDNVNKALITLSEGKKNIHLLDKADPYMQKLHSVVYKFKQTLEKNEEQQSHLTKIIDELTDSRERFYNLLDLTPTAIITINHSQNIVMFNKAAEKIFGYDSREITGQPMDILIPDQYRKHHDINVRNFENDDIDFIPAMKRNAVTALKKNGEQFYIEASIAKLSLANEALMTVAITDITERMQAEEKILRQAHFDALTKLPNRFLSLDRLSQQIKESQRNQESVALLFLDLDDFKKVNDSLGHETGDKLLIEAANRLQDTVRTGDTVGRLGGDEFIIILPSLINSADAGAMASHLISQFIKPFKIENRELILTASIGISIFPEDGKNSSELLRNADSAMYHSKELGRNTYSYFTEAMNLNVSRRLTLEEQMHGALDRGEFWLLYQPQVSVDSGNIIGTEALLRWTNPVLGDVYPDEFIPIAEHTGLIIAIGQFVLTEALNMTRQWQKDSNKNFRIAVNLSPRQFREPNLVSFVEKTIKESGMSASLLELEITEGVLMSGHNFIDEALTSLAELGVGLAMDDFGTGYSSLSYLRRYSFDTLKIDRSFINDITLDPDDRELVNAIVAMAHGLGLKVVAEGVETEAQFEHLASQGCEFVQGYFFSKPVKPEKISELLDKSS